MKLEYIRIETAGFSCTAKQSGSCGALSWQVSEQDGRFSLRLESGEETELLSVSAHFSFPFKKGDMLFLNGYQSWTDSRERGVREKMRGIDRVPRMIADRYRIDGYGDCRFVRYGRERGQQHGFTYGYVRRGSSYVLLGSLAEESGYTVIRFDTNDNSVTLEKDCRGHHFSGAYSVFDLAVLSGTEAEVFDEYFRLLGMPPAKAERITGYTSWYNRYENISEQSIAEDLAGFAGGRKLPDVFQIDDGYENAVGDWLVPNERFPSGMKAAAEKIRAAGMTPGIWLAPFTAERDSILAREHPDWLLRDEEGNAPMGGSNWSGFCGLDIYNEEVREYLKQVFDTVIRDWGFGLVKLDFLYTACLIPRRDRTRAQVMFDGMRLLRRLCGDALILGCGVPLAPAFGMVDYCRIGCDMTLNFEGAAYMRVLHREIPSTHRSLLNTIFRRQLDGRAFRCDPDVFLLRDDNIRLSAGQRKTLAVINALFGGVLFTSDNVGKYDAAKQAVYEDVEKLRPGDLLSVSTDESGVRIVYREGDGIGTVRIRLR